MVVSYSLGTLWWFWLDTHPDPPIRAKGMGFADRYIFLCNNIKKWRTV